MGTVTELKKRHRLLSKKLIAELKKKNASTDEKLIKDLLEEQMAISDELMAILKRRIIAEQRATGDKTILDL